MTQKKPLLVLVDGSSYLFRAYFALPPLTNKKGMPTGAVYGVVNMLKKLIANEKPDYLAVIFDTKAPTFRHEFDPNYKANREAMPEELAVQIPYVHAIIEALGMPLITQDGVEADDVIGTLSTKASEQKWDVLISTGDKDMAQLVNEHVTLINTMNNKRMNTDGVLEKFGVRPDQIIDYLALMGDSSDNIPGIPKVGPKTAAKWLQKHGDMDSIIQEADSFPGKIGENLRAHLEQLPKNRFLTTIRNNLDLPAELSELITKKPDKELLASLYEECNFKRWRDEVGEVALNTSKPILAPLPDEATVDSPISMNVSHALITNETDLLAFCEHLKKAEIVGIAIETSKRDSQNAACIGIALATDNNHGVYIPLHHDSDLTIEQLSLDTFLSHVNPLFRDSKTLFVGQNLKAILTVLAHHELELPPRLFDLNLAAYLLNENNGRLDLNVLSEHYLSHSPISFESIAGSGKKQLAFQAINPNEAAPYLVEAAVLNRQLHRVLTQQLSQHSTLNTVFDDIDMPLLSVLMRMEECGVLIDSDALILQSQSHAKRLEELHKEAIVLAGVDFNLSSPKQLREILFNAMGLPVIKKTPGGDPSTSEEVLKTLALNYPLPKLIMEHRQLSKLKSTYTDKLPELADDNMRIHTTYNQTSTSTGRLSSTAPNLQNIPIRTAQGRDIRRAFIAPPGYSILAADYSQVELRIMAHLSQDPNLLAAFERGDDIHRATASDVFGIPFKDVTTEQRRHAKAVNFGLLYGMSGFGLAKQLDISRSEASHYIDTYFERFPTVKHTLDRIRLEASEKGYVETCFGRRVYLPGIKAKNAIVRKAAERAAINAPMQGSAADIIKLAMIAIDDWIRCEAPEIHLVMQVHDELVFEVPDDKINLASEKIRHFMMSKSPLSVPLIVDIGTGKHWEDAH